MRVIIDINGEEITVTKIDDQESVKRVNESNLSKYARYFDETCYGWTKDARDNKMFLGHQQQYVNDLLKARKYLLLNDVYRTLGIHETKDGMIAGWVYDENTVIDFGFSVNEDFMNGLSNTTLLIFNVQYDDIRDYI